MKLILKNIRRGHCAITYRQMITLYIDTELEFAKLFHKQYLFSLSPQIWVISMGLVDDKPLQTSASSSIRSTSALGELWWSSGRALSKLAKNGKSRANQRTGYDPSYLEDEDLQGTKQKHSASSNLEIHVESGGKLFHTFQTIDLVLHTSMYWT